MHIFIWLYGRLGRDEIPLVFMHLFKTNEDFLRYSKDTCSTQFFRMNANFTRDNTSYLVMKFSGFALPSLSLLLREKTNSLDHVPAISDIAGTRWFG